MSRNYILNKWGRPQKVVDIFQFAAWFENTDRSVAETQIGRKVRVSTVFLGIDHNFTGKGKPVLWETMIFGGPYDEWCKRYTSERDAKSGHKDAVKLARGQTSEKKKPEKPTLPKAVAKKRGKAV